MTNHLPNTKIPAPCIVDTGMVINKHDIQQLLSDLSQVRYIYTLNDQVQSEGKGDIIEVFAHPNRSTLVVNHTLYLNICSFDYLELHQSPESQTCFDLVQESTRLSLIPLSNPIKECRNSGLNSHAIDIMMERFFSARLDAEIDDDTDVSEQF
ncbi:hypothetical protein RINTHH_21710 [Richelia intracellularis HH01]|uniref:Uncharacterized protein n=1 Tax=Richelia intracellularis HH01 TaxID=1165094 RepID=M1X6P6_9NOST|nr:hypothetical protein [Richelia intracellularis]CCH68326.1 hypothetical protein RINTHH_21710 [Richelia intracellularis HH01]